MRLLLVAQWRHGKPAACSEYERSRRRTAVCWDLPGNPRGPIDGKIPRGYSHSSEKSVWRYMFKHVPRPPLLRISSKSSAVTPLTTIVAHGSAL